jgi:hypothetical protein
MQFDLNHQNTRKQMKLNIITVCAAFAAVTTTLLNAGESDATKAGSPEFARMKSLVGTWSGKTDIGQGPIELTVQYKLLAGGSAVEEKVFVGTPNEMTTMYYEKDGKLALTHYCMFGNRPGMLLQSSDDKTLKFNFDKSCGINVTKESHMHALTIRFDDAETITTSCKSFMDGKEVPEHSTTLKRVKS